MNKTQLSLLAILGLIIVIGTTAWASATLTRQSLTEEKIASVETVKPAKKHKSGKNDITWNQPAQQQPAQPPQRVASGCNDHNIVGTLAGGALGGIAGNQIGNGGGKTAATIGGVLGGAYLGNQYIPTHNVTCR